MNDKQLMRVCLAVSLIGVVALFIFVQLAQPAKVAISSIDDRMLGRNVEVSGRVDALSASGGNIFMTINDGTGKIKVVTFERAARNGGVYDVKDGDNVSVTGKISLYRLEIEIVADSVKVL